MALASWPKEPDSWLLSWAIWRFKGSVLEERPTSAPKEIPKYAWEFLKWCAWRRKGALPPRPDITPKIPQWGWSLLKQLNQAVPLIPPPPPPPPPPVYVDSWTLPNPLMFTAWGWQTDSDFRNVEVIGQRMFNAGVKTVALQIGQFPPDVPNRLRAFGFKICLWGSPSANDAQAITDAVADGYLLQVEGIYEYQRALENLQNGIGAGLSLATVTTLAGFETFTSRPDGSSTTVEVEEFIKLGCTRAWVECYKQGGSSHFPISRMAWSASHRGFPYFSPLIGLYWDVYVAEYQPDLGAYGKQCGAYTAETMRPIDWYDFGNL